MRAATAALLVLLGACASGPRPLESPEPATLGARAAALAKDLVGVPYRYGGADPAKGFDCSGLVYYVYDRLGVTLPRRARDQRRAVHPVARAALEPGDLVFFRTPKDHVGVYLGAQVFVHAPAAGRKVETARLDAPNFRRSYRSGGRVGS